MKKGIALVLIFVLATTAFGCSKEPVADDGRLKVVCTNFAAYDLTRSITGKAASVTMLLKPGEESHSFEPTPRDIAELEKADLFVYTGGESDSWADTILESVDNGPMPVRMLELCEPLDEEHLPGLEAESEHGHVHEYDEHVWTSPKNALDITNGILKALLAADSQNADIYKQNADNAVWELEKLDSAYRHLAESAKRNTLVFCDKSPFLYMVKEYGFDYFAAFPGCYEGAEPDAKTVAFLIDKVKAENIPVVFYIEFSNRQMANTVSEDTGAKPLLLHSAHGITKAEFEAGATYLSLMWQNLENLKEALN